MELQNNELVLQALNEIAEQMGHSFYNPVSLGLICLNLEIDFETQQKLYIEFHKILNTHDFDDLEFDIFKKCINTCCPKSKDFSDLVIASIVIAFGKTRIPELIPFTECLKDDLLKEKIE